MFIPFEKSELITAWIRNNSRRRPCSFQERKDCFHDRCRGVFHPYVSTDSRLHQVGASIPTIRLFYELGVRYITLTHTCDNPFATSCTTVAAGKPDHGLTEIGKQAVREMNRLGSQ